MVLEEEEVQLRGWLILLYLLELLEKREWWRLHYLEEEEEEGVLTEAWVEVLQNKHSCALEYKHLDLDQSIV